MTQLPQFTEPVQEALESALHYAQENNHTEINENHLLLSFFKDPQGYFTILATGLGLNPQELIPLLESQLKHTAVFSEKVQAPSISFLLQQRIANAQEIAKKWKDTYLSSDHFFYAFWQSNSEPFASWKKKTPLSLAELEARIKK